MDWLIDTTDTEAGSARARSLLEDHLQRHAVDPAEVDAALEAISGTLDHRVAAADGRPVHLRLDWTRQTSVLDVCALRDAGVPRRDGLRPDRPVPARHRALVRSLPRDEPTRIEFDVERHSRHTFDAGPPPVVDTRLDPEVQGPAAVALALVTAIEAHPTASAPQAAAIAGSLLATSAVGEDGDLDGAGAADAFVRLHEALGSDAYVVAADDDSVELAVSRCPFHSGDRSGSTLCHVSSGLAGQLGARVHGAATVVLDETIAAGDPECHLQVALRRIDEGDGEPYFWPPRAAAPADTVPHLDLSVSLPRESVSVPVVRRLAAQALRAFGVHDEDLDDVQLAISEACANVIDHAGETDTYDVKVELAADRCAITVVDQGGGFDATSVPERPGDDSEMGRGLALMRALVDNVAFRNEPQAGAVVHMVKALRYDANHPLRRV